ncbi:hypothetical protein [Methylomonas fluvii]|nr:hypothetical protein [Methylomonas fluvii]
MKPTRCGLSVKIIQWQQCDGYQPHPIVYDDILKGKLYVNQ